MPYIIRIESPEGFRYMAADGSVPKLNEKAQLWPLEIDSAYKFIKNSDAEFYRKSIKDEFNPTIIKV